jgi:hypothetical protein
MSSSSQSNIAMGVSSSSTATALMQHLETFPSVKIKLDQLFREWVCKEGFTTAFALILETMQSG